MFLLFNDATRRSEGFVFPVIGCFCVFRVLNGITLSKCCQSVTETLFFHASGFRRFASTASSSRPSSSKNNAHFQNKDGRLTSLLHWGVEFGVNLKSTTTVGSDSHTLLTLVIIFIHSSFLHSHRFILFSVSADIYYEDIEVHFRLHRPASRYLSWQLCVFLVISVVQ